MVRPGMPVTSNPNLNILPPKMANGPTGPDGVNNGGMMVNMIPGPNMGGAGGGMQPQTMNKMMTIRQPNNIAVRGGYTIQVSFKQNRFFIPQGILEQSKEYF